MGGVRKTSAFSWEKASEECSNFGAILASINNQEEQDFITVTFILEVRRSVWVGLHDREEEGKYQWEDGSPYSYTNWAPNEPAGEKVPKEDCTELRFLTNSRNGEWNDRDCNDELPFVCQKKKEILEYEPLDARYCSDENNSGWKFRNSCYNLVEEKKGWRDAEDYCIHHYSGHLIAITDVTLDHFLNYMLKDYKEVEKIWIGISIKEANVQKWTSDWFVGYNRWRKNKDFRDGTCASRHKSGNWSTDMCTGKYQAKYAFVCESSTDHPPSLTPSVNGAFCSEEAEGWKDLGGDMCYFFETEKDVTWYEASFMCLQKGGTLASIHSQAELEVLHQFTLYTKNELHIGLHRKLQGGDEFAWSDRTDLDFENWDSGEPNRDIESCSVLYTSRMKFHNYMCDESTGFICSMKKTLPVLPTKELNETVTETYGPEEDCESGLPIPAFSGIIASVLCILSLVGIVLFWYFKPCRRRYVDNRIPAPTDDQNLVAFYKANKFQTTERAAKAEHYNPESYR